MSKSIDVEAITQLLENSDYHDWWGVEQVENYIRTPMMLDQYIVLRDRYGTPAVFATWGFPNYRHVVHYTEELEFPVSGYNGGGSVPWLIDFIAPGGKRDIALGFRKMKSVLFNKGYTQAFWLRTETGKLGFHKLRN